MADFSILILDWFRLNSRNLPWRETFDPYKIWLSEVILQQTKVEQGKNYYIKFVEAFPTVKDLANAEEDHVLNLWQGLGYYSRARNMHFSAKYIMDEFDGVFPNSYENVRSLKGVGEYTAAAICSIAYGLPHAVVDGNVYRVLSRYLEIDTPIDSTEGKKQFAKAANELLDKKHPGDYNQALMEIGALVCAPKKPNCLECPVSGSCLSNEKGTQLNYPVKAKKTKVVNRFLHFLVYTDGKSTIIKKREGKGIWQGLYDFPMLEKKEGEEIIAEDLKGLVYNSFEFDGIFKHILSHQKIMASFWVVHTNQLINKSGEVIVSINEVEDYPLPQLLIRYINESFLFGAD